MENNTKQQERARKAAQLDIEIWDALIGARGSVQIQKFVIQQRLYAYARSLVGIEHNDPEREMRITHSAAKRGPGVKIKQFIDFIEGNMSLEEAQDIRNSLQNIIDGSNVELANAS